MLEKVVGLSTKKRAEEGDAEAMWRLGISHECGIHGLPKDLKLTYEWFKKSSDLKNPAGMINAGLCLIEGVGVKKVSLME